MEPKYKIGQDVIVRPAKYQAVPPKDADIGRYTGCKGKILNYHWIRPNKGKVFFIYTIRMSEDMREIIVYEDELSPY